MLVLVSGEVFVFANLQLDLLVQAVQTKDTGLAMSVSPPSLPPSLPLPFPLAPSPPPSGKELYHT